MVEKITPENLEIILREEDFVVSKTDQAGNIIYCNPIFIEFSGYTEAELLGQPHNILRHPDMPRSIFNLLWSTISSGNEFFGYIKNLCKDGRYYWVFANVSPRYDPDTKEIIGYFSVRRKPQKQQLKTIETLYRDMLAAEQQVERRQAIAAGTAVLNRFIDSAQGNYHEFILNL